jgi:hypothetical protein
MNKLYKYASGLLLTGALSVMMVLNADAQRGGRGGGGGGSVRTSSVRGGGGGGFSVGRGSFGGYRSNVSFGLGLGFGYGNRGFYRPGLGFYGYPHVGFYLNTLPYGYYPFYFGSDLYYYAGGAFYRPYDNGGYVVTTPPVGASVPKLPRGAKSINIDGQQFYEFNGVYYNVIVNDKGEQVYVVAGKDGTLNTGNINNGNYSNLQPHVGDVVPQLPDDCHRVKLNGERYFVSPDGIYYVEITDGQGNTAYRIASISSDEDDN